MLPYWSDRPLRLSPSAQRLLLNDYVWKSACYTICSQTTIRLPGSNVQPPKVAANSHLPNSTYSYTSTNADRKNMDRWHALFVHSLIEFYVKDACTAGQTCKGACCLFMIQFIPHKQGYGIFLKRSDNPQCKLVTLMNDKIQWNPKIHKLCRNEQEQK